MNTDGSLAERSGNGLTNFARYLHDCGMAQGMEPFDLLVYAGGGLITRTEVTATQLGGMAGFWLEMGLVEFGVHAVQGVGDHLVTQDGVSFEVPPLRALDRHWTRSVLVNVGNPHCVTFVDAVEHLPDDAELRSSGFFEALRQISFKPEPDHAGRAIFKYGINLQWAYVGPLGDEIHARIFERGEGPTASSGTSATAIASAARHLSLTTQDRIRVVMPGGLPTWS